MRQIEDILFAHGIDICHETVRLWWNRFGPMFAMEIRKSRVQRRCYAQWRKQLDEVFVRINGKIFLLVAGSRSRGKALEVFVAKRGIGKPL